MARVTMIVSTLAKIIWLEKQKMCAMQKWLKAIISKTKAVRHSVH